MDFVCGGNHIWGWMWFLSCGLFAPCVNLSRGSLRRVSDVLGIPTGEALAPVLERFRKATQRQPLYQCIFHEDDGSLTKSYGLMFE